MPLHVFRNHPFWKPLPADTTRPRTRSGGIGLNSLHQDCVNLENPPDLIFFHCIRNDPAGGGTTLVCPTSDLEEEIAPEILEELARPVYMDGLAFDLEGVGDDINPFPLFDKDADWPWRYTGRILETIFEQDGTIDFDALLEFDRILSNRAIKIDLKPHDVLVVNQKKAFHGRLPMGPDQERWEIQERRLVIQAYGRL